MKDVGALVCERFRALASLELDGELAELEHAMLDSHLTHCASCRAYRADVAAFTQELGAAAPEPLERPVVLPAPRRRSLRSAQVAAAAALALAVGLGTTLGTLRSTQGSTREATSMPVSVEQELELAELGAIARQLRDIAA